MDAIASLREGLGSARWLMEGTMEGLTSDQLHWQPSGTAHSVAAGYAHLVLSEDFLINTMVQGKPPLAATSHAGKTGLSEMPPQDPGADWLGWAKKVKMDYSAFRQYAQAVNANTEAYLSGLKPEGLDRQIDFSAMGLGSQSVNWVLQTTIIGHITGHCGEIAATKGIQGLKGYPV
ncbi:MAG: DinB family protein [Dehalococcoidia bacterium]|nr:DinB family protein [Dehalococcoidia bacterium]